MKFSESWLRTFVNPSITREALCDKLTMAGLEVEEVNQIDHDHVIDLAITPNRGDCLSVRGVAREVAALTKTKWADIKPANNKSSCSDELPIDTTSAANCPVYAGRIIRSIRTNAETPKWMQERLLQSGMKIIHPVVDVTNYVMLELGQPMHAFDLNKIQQGIFIRQAKAGEKITLLDASEKILTPETLVIADQVQALAIAGVMGGLDSSVTSLTQDIFLESAYFVPAIVAKQRQYYGLNSDSAYRFERGIDPTRQKFALERATELILEIVGGKAGPISFVEHTKYLPKEATVKLTAEKIHQVLGISIPENKVAALLKALNFAHQQEKDHWLIQVPLYRSDIALPEDIIEELARLYGYDKIPARPMQAVLHAHPANHTQQRLQTLKQQCADRGYQEIVSYSFVDKTLQTRLNPDSAPYELLNPITTDMTVMRTNLWPGLINALLFNVSRQQQQVRLFEVGTCFNVIDNKLQQQPRLGGIITGFADKEQWGRPSREVDFYDLKGDVEAIISQPVTFKPATHPALHPGQTAHIYLGEQLTGLLGTLHPSIIQILDVPNKIFLFELDLNLIESMQKPQLTEISKFPEIRRDIAILVKETIPLQVIQDTIKHVAGAWLKDIFVFDVYQGKGIAPGFKSMALALIWQHPTRTLVDDEVTELMKQVLETLQGQLGAELRS